MQGNRIARSGLMPPGRLTPARAGKPGPVNMQPRPRRAHPCACRETDDWNSIWIFKLGSPLRVQGNPGHVLVAGHGQGLTPARAGKPTQRWRSGRMPRAHPCACRETSSARPDWAADIGSPLRVQGNLGRLARRASSTGLTPARAGKPRCPSGQMGAAAAHPCACRETVQPRRQEGM